MADNELVLSRDYDLPAAIVWDALVDEVLVEGWLAPARIDPREGGHYWLNWQSDRTLPATNGVITRFLAPSRLSLATDNIGRLDFFLEQLEGGTRGMSTRLILTIAVEADQRMLANIIAYWRSNFDQLEALLRGHPVDWSTWQRDRGDTWAGYFKEL